MGNASGCSGTRPKDKRSLKTQIKLQDLMSAITLQEFEKKIKRFAFDGMISVKQLSEVLSHHGHHLKTGNNDLLLDVLQNPFFHAKKNQDDEDDDGEKEDKADNKSEKSGKSGDKQEGAEDNADEDKAENEGGEDDNDGKGEEEKAEDDEAKPRPGSPSSKSSVLSSQWAECDFSKYNKAQREQQNNFYRKGKQSKKDEEDSSDEADEKEEEDASDNAADANTYLMVDKLILFAILYSRSEITSSNGNQAKALAFYHLLQHDDIIANVKKDSKRLKQLVFYMFELAMAVLRVDPDDRRRVYFREPGEDDDEDEQKHRLLLKWFYQEFQRQIFGRRNVVSCIMFMERIACKYNKDKDPNNNDDEAFMFPKKKKGEGDAKKDDESVSQEEEEGKKYTRYGALDGVVELEELPEEFEGLVLPHLQSLHINDWFDPVYLQTRIDLLKKHNKIESEDGSDHASDINSQQRE